ncbi:hypothetical protein NE237_003197 [Protea cynaroides]|uniref:Uncharacterized protein n=1 Tax=Protea cynaroides TaxID=273540 RepID=A0A9Q0KG95_9MAGN|nr:hypothetical protein NE237_003197 [Protea cynaroides]
MVADLEEFSALPNRCADVRVKEVIGKDRYGSMDEVLEVFPLLPSNLCILINPAVPDVLVAKEVVLQNLSEVGSKFLEEELHGEREGGISRGTCNPPLLFSDEERETFGECSTESMALKTVESALIGFFVGRKQGFNVVKSSL